MIPAACPCGRTHRRINRIPGSTDDMLIVRGVNIYSQQIEQVLMTLPRVGPGKAASGPAHAGGNAEAIAGGDPARDA